MQNYKSDTMFLGPSYCETCQGYTIKRLVIEKKLNGLLFVIAKIPAKKKNKLIFCDCCQQSRKPNDIEKRLIEQARKNGFDDPHAEERFVLTIDKELKRNNAYSERGYDIELVKQTANELYKRFSQEQGYDYNFYLNICEIYAITNSRKLYYRKIKYDI